MDEAALARACAEAVPAAGPDALAAALTAAVGGPVFRPALTREGWYRAGGVLAADGSRIADSLRDWAETESGGDVMELLAVYGDQGLLATRLMGRTHFLVAPTGDGPLDFLQAEVEEVTEVADRLLFDPETLPDDLEEVVDPVGSPHLEPRQVTPPRFTLRRATDFSRALAEPDAGLGADARFRRFMAEWSASSAGEAARFCDHWVLALLPFTDRFGEHRLEVKPRPADGPAIPAVGPGDIRRGSALGRLIHDFDRRLGYPMAWYFLMLANRRVPHAIAQAVHEDLMGAYAYLAARDLRVLKDWIREPYSL